MKSAILSVAAWCDPGALVPAPCSLVICLGNATILILIAVYDPVMFLCCQGAGDKPSAALTTLRALVDGKGLCAAQDHAKP